MEWLPPLLVNMQHVQRYSPKQTLCWANGHNHGATRSIRTPTPQACTCSLPVWEWRTGIQALAGWGSLALGNSTVSDKAACRLCCTDMTAQPTHSHLSCHLPAPQLPKSAQSGPQPMHGRQQPQHIAGIRVLRTPNWRGPSHATSGLRFGFQGYSNSIKGRSFGTTRHSLLSSITHCLVVLLCSRPSLSAVALLPCFRPASSLPCNLQMQSQQ